jgi:hypothetical protein
LLLLRTGNQNVALGGLLPHIFIKLNRNPCNLPKYGAAEGNMLAYRRTGRINNVMMSTQNMGKLKDDRI